MIKAKRTGLKCTKDKKEITLIFGTPSMEQLLDVLESKGIISQSDFEQ